MKSIISKQLFSCRLLLLTMFLLSVTTLSARNIIDDAFSQISFSKKDFADTIKVKVLDGAVIVPVEIDGRTRHFIFDTGSQSGNYLIEFDGKPISDICSYLFTEHKGKDTTMKFRSPDGTIKEVIINY